MKTDYRDVRISLSGKVSRGPTDSQTQATIQRVGSNIKVIGAIPNGKSMSEHPINYLPTPNIVYAWFAPMCRVRVNHKGQKAEESSQAQECRDTPQPQLPTPHTMFAKSIHKQRVFGHLNHCFSRESLNSKQLHPCHLQASRVSQKQRLLPIRGEHWPCATSTVWRVRDAARLYRKIIRPRISTTGGPIALGIA